MPEDVFPLPPRLYVVATPLGNDADLSPRARAVLAAADVVLAEDTRRAGLLFSRLGITRTQGRGFLSLHDHNEAGRVPQVLELLSQGKSVALISDAGTPVVSDPGYRLVRACRQAGLPVSPVPGPSAPATALSACGLPPLPYTFLGFLPRQKGQMQRLLARHAATGASLVFFERKDRLAATLEVALAALGDREFAVCRELTKLYEEFILGRLGRGAELPTDLLGEITVVIGPEALGPPVGPDAPDGIGLATALVEERAKGGKPREIARRVAARVPGVSLKDIYAMLLEK